MANGELPEGWETTELSAFCDYRREIVMPSCLGSNRYVGLEHLDPGRVAISRWGSDAEVRSAKHRFRAGDILYGKLRPYLDKAALADWEGVCSTDIMVLTPKNGATDAAFLALRLHSSDFIDHANATTEGVNHPRTSWSGISKFVVDAPPLPEQRAIAGVLSKLQDAVEAQDKIITTLKELKAATLAKLFREGLRGEPLKETEIGEIPESWEVVPIRNLGEIVTGTTPPTADRTSYDGDIPFIAPGDLGEFRVVRKAQKSLSKAGLKKSRSLPARSVLVVCIGSTIGKIGMTEAPISTTNQQINAITCREGLSPEFVHYLMLWNSGRIANMATPSPVPILSKGAFGEIPVAVPSDSQEAEEIAAVLCALDDSMGIRTQERTTAELLFQAMLHLLMTGEVRVPMPMA